MVEELPYLITVNVKSGKKFHIVHAEFPTGNVVTDEILADRVALHRLATIKRGDGEAVLWSRAIFGPLYDVNLQNKDKIVRTLAYRQSSHMFNPELSHIISGHTIVHHPITVDGQTNIDTGAADSYWKTFPNMHSSKIEPPKWAALTCVDLDEWKFYQATTTTFKEVEPMVITKEDMTNVRH